MTYTILLSGPSSTGSQLQTALAGAGFQGVAEATDHGFADGHETRWTGEVHAEDVFEQVETTLDDGTMEVSNGAQLHAAGDIIPGTGVIEAVEPDGPISFTRCEGDIDRAQDIAVQFGWRLRSHWERTDPLEPVEVFGDEQMSHEQRLARVERDLIVLRGDV